MTNDYHGPCLVLLDRSTTVEVRRGGRVKTVSMPTPHDEPLAGDDAAARACEAFDAKYGQTRGMDSMYAACNEDLDVQSIISLYKAS